MDAMELMKRSPLRALDAALDGGLKSGELAVIIARHGTGKTPFVVGVAVDSLLRRRRVLHVTLDMKVDHVREFYEQCFTEMMKSAGVSLDPLAFLEMERSRRIHAYLGETFSLEKLVEAVRFMRDHASFSPEVLVVDGLDFASAPAGAVAGLRDLAREIGAELWMTAVRHREEEVKDPDGIPQPVAPFKREARIIVELHTRPEGVRAVVKWPKVPESETLLDATTMLLK